MTVTVNYEAGERDLVRKSIHEPARDGEDIFGRVLFRNRYSLIPSGIRGFFESKRGDEEFFLFEQPPMLRMMAYRGQEFHVPVPWQVYVIRRQGNRFWVSNIVFNLGPITSLSDRVYYASCPNVYMEDGSSGKVCAAGQMMSLQVVEGTRIRLDKTFANAIDAFWSSNFNDDIMTFTNFQPFTHFQAGGQPLQGFKNWETIPLDHVLDLPWSQSPWSLEGIIAQCDWGQSCEASIEAAKKSTSFQRRQEFSLMIANVLNMDVPRQFHEQEPMRTHSDDGEYTGTVVPPPLPAAQIGAPIPVPA